jgi:hypothetical protein
LRRNENALLIVFLGRFRGLRFTWKTTSTALLVSSGLGPRARCKTVVPGGSSTTRAAAAGLASNSGKGWSAAVTAAAAATASAAVALPCTSAVT